ncbi:hypothetical protein VKT23_011899 [Stygiomarasmius scandens]|uniref:Uncharacterized protein n=1 Tax=Marasmiellus scandens TaxID=2682957 RepID=A0ABR1J9U4_9AGAR
MADIHDSPVVDTDILTYRSPGKPNEEQLDYFDDEKKSVSDLEVLKDSSSADEGEYEAKGDDNDPAYNVLPQIVRELCDFEDDVNMPVLTWRFYFLSAIFTALGAWLQQMGFFRVSVSDDIRYVSAE